VLPNQLLCLLTHTFKGLWRRCHECSGHETSVKSQQHQLTQVEIKAPSFSHALECSLGSSFAGKALGEVEDTRSFHQSVSFVESDPGGSYSTFLEGLTKSTEVNSPLHIVDANWVNDALNCTSLWHCCRLALLEGSAFASRSVLICPANLYLIPGLGDDVVNL